MVIDDQKLLALQESEKLYRKLLETSPDAIVVVGLTGDIQVVNQQTLRMYGYTRDEEMVGQPSFNFIAPEDQENTQKIFSDLLKTGTISGAEYVSIRKDGTRFYSESHAAVVTDEHNQPQSIIAVVHDISVRKQNEKMKTEFFSMAAHQLRTPLGVMRWNLEILLNKKNKTQIPHSLEEVIQRTYTATMQLISQVDGLLRIAQADQHSLPQNSEEVNIIEVIQHVITDLSSEATKHEVSILFTPEFSSLIKVIDKEHLYEVIHNLVANAIKYNKKNGTVSISLEKKDDGIQINIADTGIGIPASQQSQVFEKYFQARNVAAKGVQGIGLGLSLVKSYVDNWNGKIWFESEENTGTTFHISL